MNSEEQFPEVYHQCISGNFAAQLSDGVKTAGGMTDFSTNVGAVKQCKVNGSYKAELRSILHQHLKVSISNQHKDLSSLRVNRDEKEIQAIFTVLQESFVNPFGK